MEHSKAATKNNVLVAMKNGTIRLYNEKNLINEITTEDTCNGIVYGIFGREDGCLIINHQSGGMQAKILARQANLSISTVKAGAPPEQDIPLKVPQKTTLFVELTQREREQGASKWPMKYLIVLTSLNNLLFSDASAILEGFVPLKVKDSANLPRITR